MYVALLDDRCRVVDKPGCGHAAELAALRAELAKAQAERDTAWARIEGVRAALGG